MAHLKLVQDRRCLSLIEVLLFCATLKSAPHSVKVIYMLFVLIMHITNIFGDYVFCSFHSQRNNILYRLLLMLLWLQQAGLTFNSIVRQINELFIWLKFRMNRSSTKNWGETTSRMFMFVDCALIFVLVVVVNLYLDVLIYKFLHLQPQLCLMLKTLATESF